MQIKKDNIIINYTEEEKEYINDFLETIVNESKRILKFFNMEKLEYPLVITFWDDLEKYRNFRNKQLEPYNKRVQPWEVGCSQYRGTQEHYIEMLSLKERKKCEGHENDNLENIFKVGVHEYAHTCHREFKNYKETLTYINEGLATYLSNQFEDKYEFECTKEQLLKGQTKYYNFYVIMKYIVENKPRKYVLELIKNKKMQEQELDTRYEEYIKQGKRRSK